MLYVLFFAGLIVLGIGFFAGKKHVNKSIEVGFKKQIAAIENEVEVIERTADARIKPAIHAVTARIKGLL